MAVSVEIYVPKRMLPDAERLASLARALGADAEVYVVPSDFAYRLELAKTYAPSAASRFLEKGVEAIPAVAIEGRAVALGRLPSLLELAATLTAYSRIVRALAPDSAPPLPPPVEIEEFTVEGEAAAAAASVPPEESLEGSVAATATVVPEAEAVAAAPAGAAIIAAPLEALEEGRRREGPPAPPEPVLFEGDAIEEAEATEEEERRKKRKKGRR